MRDILWTDETRKRPVLCKVCYEGAVTTTAVPHRSGIAYSGRLHPKGVGISSAYVGI